MIRNTPYGKRIQSKIQRETNDHMSRSAYHHPALVPGGHFYGLPSIHGPPPHQFIGHPGAHHMQPMGDYGNPRGSPYLGGYPQQHQGPPPPHHAHHPGHPQNGQLGQMHQQQQFAPFPGMGMGAPESGAYGQQMAGGYGGMSNGGFM